MSISIPKITSMKIRLRKEAQLKQNKSENHKSKHNKFVKIIKNEIKKEKRKETKTDGIENESMKETTQNEEKKEEEQYMNDEKNHRSDKLEIKEIKQKEEGKKKKEKEKGMKTKEKKEVKQHTGVFEKRVSNWGKGINGFYIKGNKARQYYLLNNHAAITAFLVSIINHYFDIIITYPIRVSTKTLIFPRVRNIVLNHDEMIDLHSMVQGRVRQVKDTKDEPKNGGAIRINFETHYEIYHLLNDILELLVDYRIEGEIEEPSGISGDYCVYYRGKRYLRQTIFERGIMILDRMYGSRQKGEQRRHIRRGVLDEFIS